MNKHLYIQTFMKIVTNIAHLHRGRQKARAQEAMRNRSDSRKPAIRRSDWSNVKLVKRQDGQTSSWSNIKLVNPQAGQTPNWQNIRLVKRQTGRTSDWSNVKTGQTSKWSNVKRTRARRSRIRVAVAATCQSPPREYRRRLVKSSTTC